MATGASTPAISGAVDAGVVDEIDFLGPLETLLNAKVERASANFKLGLKVKILCAVALDFRPSISSQHIL